MSFVKPEAAPPVPRSELGDDVHLARRVAHALVAPIVLIVAVLGSILGGVATPTEAAGVGAIGATLLGGHRQRPDRPLPIYVAAFSLVLVVFLTATVDMRVARTEISAAEWVAIAVAFAGCAGIAWGVLTSLARVHRDGTLVEVNRATVRISAMVFGIVIGAQMFSLVFRGFGGDDLVHEFLTGLPGGVFGAMLVVMLLMFLMGFFLDFIEITFVVVPIVAPVLLLLGLNPVWLGIMIAVNLQTSFLTPPFGFALFYLRGVAPPEVTTAAIYRGIIPFVAIQLVALIIIATFPGLATWLPGIIYGASWD